MSLNWRESLVRTWGLWLHCSFPRGDTMIPFPVVTLFFTVKPTYEPEGQSEVTFMST